MNVKHAENNQCNGFLIDKAMWRVQENLVVTDHLAYYGGPSTVKAGILNAFRVHVGHVSNTNEPAMP